MTPEGTHDGIHGIFFFLRGVASNPRQSWCIPVRVRFFGAEDEEVELVFSLKEIKVRIIVVIVMELW